MQRITRYLAAQATPDREEDLRAAEESFRPFEDRWIRHIRIVRLSVASGRPEVAADPGTGADPPDGPTPVSRRERAVEWLHADTRRGTVRQYLLVREGERLDPVRVADSERLLREAGLFSVATIEAVPVPEALNEVDLEVIVRDLWSIGIAAPVRDLPEISFRVYDRNLFGLGHHLELRREYDPLVADRRDRRVLYRANNIAGSFIRVEVGLRERRDRERRAFLSINRPPLAPEIRATGAFLSESVRQQEPDDSTGSTRTTTFERHDGWLGYGLTTGDSADGRERRAVLLPMIRVIRLHYLVRPEVESNSPWAAEHDQVTALAGFHFGRTSYRETRLVSGFGRVEDVPLGYLAALNLGREFGKTTHRPYAGIRLALAHAGGRAGTSSGSLQVGGYRSGGRWECSVARIGAGWFSELLRWGRFRHRQFLRTEYTADLAGRGDRFIGLDEGHGLRGVRENGPRGRARWSADLESVTFTPWSVLGFRMAAYLFGDVGAVAKEANRFREARHYTSLGLGLRLKNEQLALDAVDLRFAFVPARPPGAELEPWRAGSAESYRFETLVPRPPEIVPYD